MVMLGRCFMKKELWDLAKKQLASALEGIGGVGPKSLDIVYTLGLVHEHQELLEEALGHYTQIYEIDISYKDVAKKIDILRSRIAT